MLIKCHNFNAMDMFNDLKERGLVYQVSNEEKTREYLSKKNNVFYCGFDPSAASLQIGNLLIIVAAKRLELAGLKPIVLVGGATGLIGDPSFGNKERILKTEEEVGENIQLIKKQLSRFFDFSKTAVLVNNYEWFKNYSFINFIRDTGKKFTVNEMIAKEAVKSRMETGLSFAEFSYVLIQAYDFLRLYEDHKCELQLGGSDQWGNITAGIEFIRKTKAREVFGLTLPLVTTLDGKKFGKSEGNAVWLDANLTSPYHFYQFWINIDDKDVIKFLKYYTFLSLEEIMVLENSVISAPEKREAQKSLAKEATAFVHGEESCERARKITENLFAGKIKDLDEKDLKEIFMDSSVVSLENFPTEGLNIFDFLIQAKATDSKRQAREDIQNNAIELNGSKVLETDHLISKKDFLFGKYIVVKRGKKDYKFIACDSVG